MRVRLSVDDSLKVIEACSVLAATPFPECVAAADPVCGLAGASVGRGWRQGADRVRETALPVVPARERRQAARLTEPSAIRTSGNLDNSHYRYSGAFLPESAFETVLVGQRQPLRPLPSSTSSSSGPMYS
jgi:hypothetical protein